MTSTSVPSHLFEVLPSWLDRLNDTEYGRPYRRHIQQNPLCIGFILQEHFSMVVLTVSVDDWVTVNVMTIQRYHSCIEWIVSECRYLSSLCCLCRVFPAYNEWVKIRFCRQVINLWLLVCSICLKLVSVHPAHIRLGR